MGLRDILFGRKRLPAANVDHLFRISTVGVTMEAELGLEPSGAAAVVYRPLSAAQFESTERDLHELLDAVARQSGSTVTREVDDYEYGWIVVRDTHLEDLVTAAHLIATEMKASGFGAQLLAATFGFRDRDRAETVQLIYGFKTGTFWPFVPTGDGHKRDNPEELRLTAALEAELPMEGDLSRWLGLFDAPL